MVFKTMRLDERLWIEKRRRPRHESWGTLMLRVSGEEVENY